MTDALEERGKEDPIPPEVKVEAVGVTRQLVTDDLTVAAVANLGVAEVNLSVAVKILEFNVTGLPCTAIVVLDPGLVRTGDLLTVGVKVGRGEVTVILKSPDLTEGHA